VLGYQTAAGYWSVAAHMSFKNGGWPMHKDETNDEDVLKSQHMNAILANPGMKGHVNEVTYSVHKGEPDYVYK
jgi:hypothetical protein